MSIYAGELRGHADAVTWQDDSPAFRIVTSGALHRAAETIETLTARLENAQSQLDAIRELHQCAKGANWCRHDGHDWPCGTAVLADPEAAS